MHLGYEGAAALDRQLELYRQGDAIKPGSRYLFDKLLHNDYVLKPERLDAGLALTCLIKQNCDVMFDRCATSFDVKVTIRRSLWRIGIGTSQTKPD